MTRPKFRRSLRFDSLESRQLMSNGGPSAQAQYMLELINQARTNPAAAADRVTSNLTPDITATINYYNVDLNAAKQAIASTPAKPPLAWDAALGAAAQGHSQDMANTQVQSHTGSDGSSAVSRMDQAGYKNIKSSAENAYAYATSVDEAMQAFLIDWGVADLGHRRNLMQPNTTSDNAFQSVGIGLVNTGNSSFGPLVVTQNFASQKNAPGQLLGVVYNDSNSDNFYEPGEGQPNVRIDAVNLDTGATFTSSSLDAGGYQLPLSAGRYQVIASVNDTVVKSVAVNMGTQNVKQDFTLSGSWDGRTRQQAIAAVTPATSPAITPVSTPAPVVAVIPASPSPTPSVVGVSLLSAATTVPAVSTVAPSPLGAWTSWKANRA